MTPYYPLPFRKTDGVNNTVINTYIEEFTDAVGNIADVTYVDYKDKDGKIKTKYPLRYKWKT